ncbi:hypothetical protein PU629_07140 [Pullulanibacillus sp. KACC 23026]|uniref:hypothetical protein n=1 Tax=Pullulanibacillus sp. KACC 23026 TaxID=3028315 RepID=UPI0023AF69D6|nr:hypothetical protein [Pullulanibacillus sp. KACC 23026]WEG14133.1 hypothetical protein PU629_07140 [Pullulanibacillus sp. KACC 23026]
MNTPLEILKDWLEFRKQDEEDLIFNIQNKEKRLEKMKTDLEKMQKDIASVEKQIHQMENPSNTIGKFIPSPNKPKGAKHRNP